MMDQQSASEDSGAVIRQLEKRVAELEAARQLLEEDILRRNQTEASLRQRERRLRTIIETEPECVKVLGPDGSLREMNPAGLKMLEADSFEQVANNSVFPLIVPMYREKFQRLTERVFQGESGTLEFQLVGLKGTPLWLETHATPLRNEQGRVISLLAVTRNVTERKQAEALGNGQKQVLEMISSGAPLAAALTELVCVIESQASGMLGSILLLDEDGLHVRHGAAPSLPLEYVAAIDGEPIGPCAGSCGTAAFRNEAVYVEDIATDPLWADYRTAALSHGLRACWSTPIFDAKQKVLGTFAMYYGQPGLPQPRHLRLIDIATHFAALAIGRHRDDAALRESVARFRNLFEQASDGVFLITADNRYLDANPRGCEMLGYTRDELLQVTVADVLAPQEVERLAVEPPRMMSGLPHFAEWEHVRKDGTMFPGEVSARRLDDHTYLAIVRDLTARRQAEAALRENEQQLRLFVDHSPAAIAMFDRNMRYLVVSRRWRSDYHLGEQSLVGRSHYDVFPEMPERWKEIHRRCLGGAVEKGDADEFRREDGSTDWVSWEIRPWYHAQGDVGGVIIFSEVVTERKRAQEALREADLRQRLAVAASKIGLWDWNLVTNDVYFSAEWKSQLGYADDEIPNRLEEWKSRLHPDDLAPTLAKVRRLVEDPAADYAVEFRLRHKDGSYQWIFTQAQVIRDGNGRPERMLGCHVDITERKLAEQNIREQLDELLRWQAVTLGREGRIRELKAEVNALLAAQEQPARYTDPSA